MSDYLWVPFCSVLSAAWSSQGWLYLLRRWCCFAFGYKMSASPYRLLTHFGSVIQRFGSCCFFIFEIIWVHNGAERWVRCRFSWLASKVVSSLKLIYFHIIISIIITIILYLEYLDFSLFSLKARKKHLINTKLCFWGINRIPFPHPCEKKGSFPVSIRTL